MLHERSHKFEVYIKGEDIVLKFELDDEKGKKHREICFADSNEKLVREIYEKDSFNVPSFPLVFFTAEEKRC